MSERHPSTFETISSKNDTLCGIEAADSEDEIDFLIARWAVQETCEQKGQNISTATESVPDNSGFDPARPLQVRAAALKPPKQFVRKRLGCETAISHPGDK